MTVDIKKGFGHRFLREHTIAVTGDLVRCPDSDELDEIVTLLIGQVECILRLKQRDERKLRRRLENLYDVLHQCVSIWKCPNKSRTQSDGPFSPSLMTGVTV